MKKILGIVGSPRRNGNTHILVSRILEGASEQGAVTNIIFLGDYNINECDGCHVCWKGYECIKMDDMNQLFPLISDSDALIFGTPVYWYAATGLMKLFVDRFVYFNCPENRSTIKGKIAALAIPFEENNLSTADLVTAFFERSMAYLEMRLVGAVLAPGSGEKGGILKNEKIMSEGYNLGRNLAHMLKTPLL